MAEGVTLTGRVITAAAAIMVCVFLSFVLGDERTLKEFGFVLAVAVFLDALVVRCMLLPATLELLGPLTWRLPRWLDASTASHQHRGLGRLAHFPRPGASRSVEAGGPRRPPSPSRRRRRPDGARLREHREPEAAGAQPAS